MTLELTPAEISRFWLRLPDSGAGCREWTSTTDRDGYGRFYVYRGDVRHVIGAHRVAFYLANGYWPEECRHTCDNPPCCEEGHLLDGTKSDNQKDAVERGLHASTKKTRCPSGHPFDEENTYIRPDGKRGCRSCRREDSRRRRKLRRAA